MNREVLFFPVSLWTKDIRQQHCSIVVVQDGRLPLWLSGKEFTCNTGTSGDIVSIPGLGRSPGGGNGTPLQYSCLETLMGRGV